MWKINTDTSKTLSDSAKIHAVNGFLTYGGHLCGGVPDPCSSTTEYSVTYYLDEDDTKFDPFNMNIERTLNIKSCNQEALVMWFNDGNNTAYTSVLTNNSIFDMKNVDECEHIIMSSGSTNLIRVGGQKFLTSNYVDSGYPKIYVYDTTNHEWTSTIKYVNGRTYNGHKIKYHTISDTIPTSFFSNGANKKELVELYFPCRYNNANEGKNIINIGGANAFRDCIGLSAITFGVVENIRQGSFYGCTNLKVIDWGHHCDDECSIESRLKTIGQDAFNGCTSLTELNLPYSLETIGQTAFDNCTNLTKLRLGGSIRNIGNGAFSGCTNLNDVFVSQNDPPQIAGNILPISFLKNAGQNNVKVPYSHVTDYENSGWAIYNITGGYA